MSARRPLSPGQERLNRMALDKAAPQLPAGVGLPRPAEEVFQQSVGNHLSALEYHLGRVIHRSLATDRRPVPDDMRERHDAFCSGVTALTNTRDWQTCKGGNKGFTPRKPMGRTLSSHLAMVQLILSRLSSLCQVFVTDHPDHALAGPAREVAIQARAQRVIAGTHLEALLTYRRSTNHQ